MQSIQLPVRDFDQITAPWATEESMDNNASGSPWEHLRFVCASTVQSNLAEIPAGALLAGCHGFLGIADCLRDRDKSRGSRFRTEPRGNSCGNPCGNAQEMSLSWKAANTHGTPLPKIRCSASSRYAERLTSVGVCSDSPEN